MAHSCAYDGHPFDGSAFQIPEAYVGNRYVLSPLTFCSPSCAKSCMLERHSENMALFTVFYATLGLRDIITSPHRDALACYHLHSKGLRIDEFRAATKPIVRQGILSQMPEVITAQTDFAPLVLRPATHEYSVEKAPDLSMVKT